MTHPNANRVHSSTPANLAKPERWPLPEESIYEWVGYCTMLHFLTLGASVNTLKFGCFGIKVCYEKLGRMLELIVPKIRSNISSRLKDFVEKQVLRR